MKLYFPSYYHSFRCIAGECPDSCCKEWTVDVDPLSAQYYRQLPGDLGDRLRSVLQDTEDGAIMVIENNRCPMWQQDGLCRIQAELGHDALCKTCREFPRLHHDFGDFVELGLEMSCPEAARLILTSQEDHFLCQTVSDGEPPEYDREIMAVLRTSREEMLHFLENSTYPLPQSLAILLLHSHSVQSQIDGGEATTFDPALCLASAEAHRQSGDIQALFAFYKSLEILTPKWSLLLDKGPAQNIWRKSLLAFARYGIQRYWLQAISDFDLVGRVKLILSACLLISAMTGDPINIAQLYSKEIENNPDNIDAILDGAYYSPALTDVNLISLLLTDQEDLPG